MNFENITTSTTTATTLQHSMNMSKSSKPHSTFRDSKLNAFAWKSGIDHQMVQDIQEVCHKPMKKLGYNLVQDQGDLDDPDFPLLIKSAQDISKFNLE